MFATNVVIIKVIAANTKVKAILPLKFALKGKNGFVNKEIVDLFNTCHYCEYDKGFPV